MKKITLITAIAMTLTSTAVLAEQGSGELNQIVHPSSSANYSTDTLHMTPADLPLVNGGAENNSVVAPSSHINHSSNNEDQIALSDLPHRNAS
ncbi:hypothetical protein J7J47_20740 [Halomonas sp. ISL-60]|uniref:hypothetical protein n=1 Tax=unclassified Halomonas TaxID=2609666 RepID=UPI0007D8EE92|nr:MULTISPECIES: hypothetical protein [unclassified Halomonas]MBT2774659.1 hypothetical protein [Halomonas sp. ISL-60]MBT2788665.1 hypothetical protein [Halomonas sp. ISL-106]MBT2798256.1 hypothetical protein [Halomonas sp. ISL-104]MBT2803286.1 hypothetical protein [Halomonas sp. ISL-56]OAL60803.1 hypothetical protein A6R74_19005 [Halomonas sp. ALS9]